MNKEERKEYNRQYRKNQKNKKDVQDVQTEREYIKEETKRLKKLGIKISFLSI